MNKMIEFGILLSLTDMASGRAAVVKNALGDMTRSGVAGVERLGAAITKTSTQLVALGAASVATGGQLMHMVSAPIGAFVRLDDAVTELQVSMMKAGGKVGDEFKEIKRQAIELGNALPGTTTDFVKVANALLQQGTAMDALLGGGLKSAAYLSVVLKMPGEQAGEMVAKLREAYNLADNELGVMADKMQRARFAFGMKPDDLKVAASYQAPILNVLGIGGQNDLQKMLAIQGVAANVGLESGSFGTNFSMMLTRLAKGPAMVEQAKKGMKGEARKIMEEMNITFDFFDKKGKFKGLDAMIQELEKLQLIRAKLGDKAALEVADAMFGAEAGRPALILAQKGVAGYRDALQKMEQQASLTDRIARTTQSARNTWDALTGSIENALALLAEPAVEWAKPLINSLNEGVGKLGAFIEQHKTLAKWTVIVVGGIGAILAVVGTLALTLGLLGKVMGGPLSLLGKLFGKKGGAAGGLADALGAQKVFVTNWPGGFGGLGGGSLPDGRMKPSERMRRLPGGAGGASGAGGAGGAAARGGRLGAMWGALRSRASSIGTGVGNAVRAVSGSRIGAVVRGVAGRAGGLARGLGSVVGRAAVPLQVGMAALTAGSALASSTASNSEKATAVGGAMGGLAGGLAGAKVGALVGTMIMPGVGTVIGGLLGGAVGGIAGQWLGGKAGGAVVSDKPAPVVVKDAPPPKPSAADKKPPPAPIEVKIDYKPNVVIHGDPTPQSIQKFGEMLRSQQQTLETMLKRLLADQQRKAF